MSSPFLEKNQDFVLKLKIKAADGQTQIRRVRLPRIADSSGNVSYEELVGLVVVFTFPELTFSGEISRYQVSLTYYDVDGDSVTIASSEELLDACEQFVCQKALRITTYVKPLATSGVVPPLDRTPSPSFDNGTLISTASTQSIQVRDILESFVGVLSTAVSHLQEGLAAPTAKNPRPSFSKPVECAMNEAKEAVDPVVTEESKISSEDDGKTPAEAESPTFKLESDDGDKEYQRPFIHGRHTCDSCLSTPIIGIRYHSTNLNDYDLCESCFENYKGKEIVFEPAELERDRDAQNRWYRRWDNARRMRRGRFGRVGPRGQRFSRPGMKADHTGCKPPSPPSPLPLTGLSPPPSSDGGCLPPPPPEMLCSPPPPPNHPPSFGHPPYSGPTGLHEARHWVQHHLGPHFAPHVSPPTSGLASEFDSALKEAIRRSLSDIAPKEADISKNGETPVLSVSVEDSDELKKSAIETEPQVERRLTESVDGAAESDADEIKLTDFPRSVEIVMDSHNAEGNKSSFEDMDDAKAMEKSMHETESVDSEKLSAESHDFFATASSSKTQTPERTMSDSSKEESFASDAKGSGDVAEAMGAALDAVVDVIREMQAESSESDAGRKNGELILDSTELVQKLESVDDDAEWSVVKSVGSDGTTESEQIAKAAEMLGSALFNSDMKNSSENIFVPSVAGSSFSVPSSVSTDIGTEHSINAPACSHMERWAVHLLQLRELGFDNEQECVEVMERLEAANIGVDADDDISINHVVNELLEKCN